MIERDPLGRCGLPRPSPQFYQLPTFKLLEGEDVMAPRMLGWKIDRTLVSILAQLLADAGQHDPEKMDTDQVETNTALCVLVEFGLADLMRDKNGRPYWGCRDPQTARKMLSE